jgi:hypothetical protein
MKIKVNKAKLVDKIKDRIDALNVQHETAKKEWPEKLAATSVDAIKHFRDYARKLNEAAQELEATTEYEKIATILSRTYSGSYSYSLADAHRPVPPEGLKWATRALRILDIMVADKRGDIQLDERSELLHSA